VLAARQHLDINDRWWVARVYTEGWVVGRLVPRETLMY
jgi:hypothetical protein